MKEQHSSAETSTVTSLEQADKQAVTARQWSRIPRLVQRPFVIFVALVLITVALALGLGLGLGLRRQHKSTGPLVDLGYARYEGRTHDGVNEWLGLRYAAAPTGRLRFAAPQPPISMKETQSATKRGSRCLPVRGAQSNRPPSPGYSEDCLSLEVYAPANASTTSHLPVYVFVPGGGFVQVSGVYNGSTLVKASDMQIVVVVVSYRVGPFGFLASEEVQSQGSLNNGLKDQRQALNWFGGDPDHVVLGGASAGAASVTLQLAAYGGRDENLFQATIAESQSFAALRTVGESQYQYDELVKRTKCDIETTGSNRTLDCLQSLSTTNIQSQNYGMPFPGTTRNPLFAYNPTLDYDFIPDYTLNLFESGRYVKLPAIYGDASDEGTVFAPKQTKTETDFSSWLEAQFPALNTTQLAWFSKRYPPDKQFPGTGRYWQPLAKAYGELRYVCPGIFLSNEYANGGVKGNWNYNYAVLDPHDAKVGVGTPHCAELNAIWGGAPGSPRSYKTTNANIIPLMQKYWISFIRSYDPNKYRVAGAPTWERWTATGYGDSQTGRQRLLVQNGEDERTVMETVDAEQWSRCRTLSSWGIGLGQ
ncbi:MAG: hypothetical protein LQ351_006978 [Letrouitia transgressa]|nr:MAG: hypothetical protein LQ351_006978 [Letrouitia transgressa]